MKSKRGISPLIATVLIIGFTIVLAALVITWGTGLFKKTVGTTERESQFNILCTTGIDYEATVKKKGIDLTGYFVTISNKKDKTISGFYFVAENDAGITETFTTDTSTELPSAQKKVQRETTPGSDVWNDIMAPGLGSANAFATLQLKLATLGDYDEVEIRPIVALDTGEKKVCDQFQTATVISA